jgi:hypothetical protein
MKDDGLRISSPEFLVKNNQIKMLIAIQSLPVSVWQTIFFARYDFTGVRPVVLYGLGLLSVLIVIGDLLSSGSAAYPLAMIISWGVAAPYCVRWARQGRLSVTRAFAIGIILGLLGLLIYWIYFKGKGGSKEGTPV